MSQVAETLKQARELIKEPEKWAKGYYRDGDRYCTIGAVVEAANVNGPSDGISYLCLDVLRACVPLKGCGSLSYFNDNPYTTHEDIMQLFDCAIAKEKARSK